MRVSTNQLQQAGVNAILDQQFQAGKTQLQIASGQRILTPSDDPVGSTRILDLEQAIKITDQYQANAEQARARLGLEETVLTSAGNLLQRARELAIQGNNDTLNKDDRASLAVEVRELLAQMLALANTKDANGEYIFAGYQGLTQPFAANGAGGFTYNGDAGQRFLQIGPTRQIAIGDSGSAVFREIRTGNGVFTTQSNPANTGTGIIAPGTVSGSFTSDTYTITFIQAVPTNPVTYEVRDSGGALVTSGTYTDNANIGFNGASVSVTGQPANNDRFTVSPSANQDVFTTLQNFASALESGATAGAGLAQFHNAINRFLADVNQVEEQILAVRASVGARHNVIDDQKNSNDSFTLQAESALSLIQDLDYAEAISQLNRQLLGLEAAQQAYIRVQGLSLFNFLR